MFPDRDHFGRIFYNQASRLLAGWLYARLLRNAMTGPRVAHTRVVCVVCSVNQQQAPLNL